MAKQQQQNDIATKEGLESKLKGLKDKLIVLENRGTGWSKAILRTKNFIKEAEEAIANFGKAAPPAPPKQP